MKALVSCMYATNFIIIKLHQMPFMFEQIVYNQLLRKHHSHLDKLLLSILEWNLECSYFAATAEIIFICTKEP